MGQPIFYAFPPSTIPCFSARIITVAKSRLHSEPREQLISSVFCRRLGGCTFDSLCNFPNTRVWWRSTRIANMHKVLTVVLIAVIALMGCNKSKSSTASGGSSTTVSTDDPVQKKLQELAGGSAKNCGLLTSQAAADLEPASRCAMDAAKAKNPFYVEYQLPGMNVAVAGDAQGKLYSVQSQAGGAGVVSGDCPAELRIAPSGRVTCYAPGTFPMGAGAGSHSNMPGMGMGGAGALPPGHPSPTKPPAKP